MCRRSATSCQCQRTVRVVRSGVGPVCVTLSLFHSFSHCKNDRCSSRTGDAQSAAETLMQLLWPMSCAARDVFSVSLLLVNLLVDLLLINALLKTGSLADKRVFMHMRGCNGAGTILTCPLRTRSGSPILQMHSSATSTQTTAVRTRIRGAGCLEIARQCR